MTPSSRLAIAPAVAFALSFAVVLALGYLVTQIVGDGSGATSAAPTPGTIEFDGKRYSFGPVSAGTTFTRQLSAQVGRLDDDRKVQVCVTIPAGTTIPDREWTQRVDGRSCTAEESGSIVRFRLERAR